MNVKRRIERLEAQAPKAVDVDQVGHDDPCPPIILTWPDDSPGRLAEAREAQRVRAEWFKARGTTEAEWWRDNPGATIELAWPDGSKVQAP